MGILGDPEIEHFEKEEMAKHYTDGYCNVPGCHFCEQLKFETDYWEDWENEMIRREMEEWDNEHDR